MPMPDRGNAPPKKKTLEKTDETRSGPPGYWEQLPPATNLPMFYEHIRLHKGTRVPGHHDRHWQLPFLHT